MALRRFLQDWSTPPRLTRLLIAVAIVFIIVEGFYAIVWRQNDYSVHLRYGRFFLEGLPYQTDDATAYYPLGRLWMDASLASFEYYASRTLCYVTAIVSLAVSLRIWQILARPAAPIPRQKQVAAIGWTLFILSPFIIRDLDECGLQLLLLFFLTAAGYCLVHRRHALCGFWLGVAIVYKATPLLFLPLLLWKRQWRAAGWTVAFTIMLSLLPATYLGWRPTLDAHAFWFNRTASILEHQQAYPSVPGIEEPKVQNESLKALVARYVVSYPPGHPLHLDHPLFAQFGSLTDQAARPVVTGVIVLLGALVALRMRRRWTDPLDNPQFAPDWATACLFAALLSPLCWRQHLVMAIPCAYLVARERLAPAAAGGWRKWLPVIAAILILGSRRGVLGEELSILMLSYKIDTLAALAYILLCLTLPTRYSMSAVLATSHRWERQATRPARLFAQASRSA